MTLRSVSNANKDIYSKEELAKKMIDINIYLFNKYNTSSVIIIKDNSFFVELAQLICIVFY